MPTTTKRGYRYPGQGQEPDVAGDVQRLAEDVANDVDPIAGRVAALEGGGYAEFTAGSSSHPANTNWGPGQFTETTSRAKNNTFAKVDIPDCIALTEPGVYLVHYMAMGTSVTPASGYLSFRDKAETITLDERNVGGSMSWNYAMAALVYVDATQAATKITGATNTGFLVRVRTFLGGAHTSTGRMKIAKISPTL